MTYKCYKLELKFVGGVLFGRSEKKGFCTIGGAK